ncbi:MFS transporter [Amycolatopsis sp. YIM 10]|uniref:MFS transporter n=1 Tax=Amycolatopsis sp. YIM 10 TaxID=2653857 RepID=UPI00128FF83B|nr:MFS transporter [Amycolatopsis sp. YIM 10]QFU89689.1 putative MFS-type transporter EfpA [Amycolatopsis sp. YIM 10]
MSTVDGERRWWALALIAAAQFMVIMDTSIIGVALPRIQADLGFSQENLSWVFNAYVVAFGGLLLLGGRLSDLLGARRIFATGWVVLLAGSLVAGLAGQVWAELAGRAIQGAGAALIAPSALTLLTMLFGGEPKELTKALALYGAAAPAGGTAGVFLGGVITEYISWPWVFYINTPIALLTLAAIPALMPRGAAQRGSIDVLGAITVTAGLGVAVYSIVRAPESGWASFETILGLVIAVVLLGAFVGVQSARKAPLVRLGIFRTPDLAAANLAQLLLGAAWIPMWFFLNLYLQQVLGLGAFPSGSALLPMTLTIMVMMIAPAPRLTARFGTKPLVVTGLAVLGAGLVWVASGIVNTGYQIGSALGLAAMTALASSFGAGQLTDTQALTNGLSASFLGAAAVAFAGALLAAGTLNRRSVTSEKAGAAAN